VPPKRSFPPRGALNDEVGNPRGAGSLRSSSSEAGTGKPILRLTKPHGSYSTELAPSEVSEEVGSRILRFPSLGRGGERLRGAKTQGGYGPPAVKACRNRYGPSAGAKLRSRGFFPWSLRFGGLLGSDSKRQGSNGLERGAARRRDKPRRVNLMSAPGMKQGRVGSGRRKPSRG
jgi:hypothetical protein